MTEENGEKRRQGIKIKAFGIEFEMRGLSVIMGTMVLLLVGNSWMIFTHAGSTEAAINRASRAQRFFACILAQPMEKREEQLLPGSSCHVMSKVVDD